MNMFFACQKDSYLKELTTKVLSCTPVVEDKVSGETSYYEVVLEDTVLFPEGGGQPDDRGTVNGIDVIGVKRRNDQAVHQLKSPVTVGKVVKVSVDWSRRFDHMQQHTGQHLITAITDALFDFRTKSWSLGEEESFIALDTPKLNSYEIENIEQMVNEVIRNSVPVIVHYYDKGNPQVSMVRNSVSLPKNHDGPIRVVDISGIDTSTCCGTHVKSTSELQAIKLLGAKKGKKSRTNLHFVVGERLIQYTKKCIARETKLTAVLGCSPDEHHVLVETLQLSLKDANKKVQTAFRDVASLEARLFNLQRPPPPYFFLHKNAEPDFISVFMNEAKSDETLFFLTVGEPKTGGHMMLSGPLPLVEKYGPQVCEILDGKGTITDGKFQGKIKLVNIPKAEELLKSVFIGIVSQ